MVDAITNYYNEHINAYNAEVSRRAKEEAKQREAKTRKSLPELLELALDNGLAEKIGNYFDELSILIRPYGQWAIEAEDLKDGSDLQFWAWNPTSERYNYDLIMEVAPNITQNGYPVLLSMKISDGVDYLYEYNMIFGPWFLEYQEGSLDALVNEVNSRISNVMKNMLRGFLWNRHPNPVGDDGTIYWRPNNIASTYKFRYPPHENSLTNRFLTFIKENPGSTASEFYESEGRTRRPGHNSMFFGSIKDAGLVRMERKGRQFVYYLGPNYKAWTQDKLKRYR